MGVDVLNLEWDASLSRDRQMASLVCNYLRFQGVTVVEGSVFDGYELIRKLTPRILFISNTTGAQINFDIADYANKCGIKVVSLVSEGNFRESEIDQFLWGWNIDKRFVETINMQWTSRTYQMTLKHYPELCSKIRVSGAVGFDVYKILPRICRGDFLKKYRKERYQNIIGVGCWDFGIFYPKDTRFQYQKSILNPDEIEYFRRDGELFNEILHKVILENPQILFILKEHPGVQLGKKASAIESLENYSNVLVLKKEEPIANCLAVSDFWITYESTTALEAWLMDRQTCLLNPQGGRFKRDKIAEGSPIYSSYEVLQRNIIQFYAEGYLDGYKEKMLVRESLIEDTIQWSDGFNHVRAGNVILNILKEKRNGLKLKPLLCDTKKMKYMVVWKLCSIPFFKKKWAFYLEMKKRFTKEKIAETDSLLMKYQKEFYQRNGLNGESLKKYICQ